MSTAHQPSRGSHANGTARTRKPRPRSTIGVNALDLSPLPTSVNESDANAQHQITQQWTRAAEDERLASALGVPIPSTDGPELPRP